MNQMHLERITNVIYHMFLWPRVWERRYPHESLTQALNVRREISLSVNLPILDYFCRPSESEAQQTRTRLSICRQIYTEIAWNYPVSEHSISLSVHHSLSPAVWAAGYDNIQIPWLECLMEWRDVSELKLVTDRVPSIAELWCELIWKVEKNNVDHTWCFRFHNLCSARE